MAPNVALKLHHTDWLSTHPLIYRAQNEEPRCHGFLALLLLLHTTHTPSRLVSVRVILCVEHVVTSLDVRHVAPRILSLPEESLESCGNISNLIGPSEETVGINLLPVWERETSDKLGTAAVHLANRTVQFRPLPLYPV